MAASRSASAKTRNGALPPSSIEQLTTWSAASLQQHPADLGRAGERQLAHPRVVQHRRHDRAGPPGRQHVDHARRARRPRRGSRAIASAVSGVSLAGLRTTVQPAASAGPILRVAIAAGKFHGVTSTQMPTGWCSTRIWFAPDGAVMHRADDRAPPPRRTSGRTRRRRRPRRGRRRSALPFSSEISRASSLGLRGHQLEGPAQDLGALARRRSRPTPRPPRRRRRPRPARPRRCRRRPR